MGIDSREEHVDSGDKVLRGDVLAAAALAAGVGDAMLIHHCEEDEE